MEYSHIQTLTFKIVEKHKSLDWKHFYAAYKNKKPEEVSMFEFLSFLKSQPKVELKWTPIEWNNSETGKDEISHKNFVARFI